MYRLHHHMYTLHDGVSCNGKAWTVKQLRARLRDHVFLWLYGLGSLPVVLRSQCIAQELY